MPALNMATYDIVIYLLHRRGCIPLETRGTQAKKRLEMLGIINEQI